MVCERCVIVVEHILHQLPLQAKRVEMGYAELTSAVLTKPEREQLAQELLREGFELILDPESQLVEQIKTVVLHLVREHNAHLSVNLSVYLQEEFSRTYTDLSALFLEHTHQSIEHFFLLQKIERIKELLFDNELRISEIAQQLNYSSVSYLSNQFKKFTGYTPTQYKKQQQYSRRFLDSL